MSLAVAEAYQPARADPDLVDPEPPEPVDDNRDHQLRGHDQRHHSAGAERAHRDQADDDHRGAPKAADQLHGRGRAETGQPTRLAGDHHYDRGDRQRDHDADERGAEVAHVIGERRVRRGLEPDQEPGRDGQ